MGSVAFYFARSTLPNSYRKKSAASAKQLLPLLNRVVVKRPPMGSMYRTGNSSTESEAVVVAVGPDVWQPVSVGDRLSVPSNHGTTLVVEGEELTVLSGDELWNRKK